MSTAKKALTGTFFVAINSYMSLFIYFVSGVLLARVLEPADFGVFRIALFFVDLIGRVREFGLDKALIHKQEELPKAYRTHFTIQLTLSFLSFIIVLSSAPLILKYYPPSTFLLMLFLSVSYVFQSVGTTQRIALEKELMFSKTAVIDIISLTISSFVSVIMAVNGFGSASLVVGYGLNFALATIMLWALRPWKIKLSETLLFDKEQIKWYLKFGSFLFLGGITTFVLYKYNDFILGTFLSVAALGFYSRAFNYAQIPTSLITSVISKVALPTYSALQNDKEKLSNAFTIVLKSIVRISFPLSAILYLVADDFTVFLLGYKWMPMVPIFRVLILYGVLRSIFDDLGELFTAIGKPKFVSFYLLLQAVVSLFLAPLMTKYFQATGAAVSLSIVLLLGVIVAYVLVWRVLRISTINIFLPSLLVTLASIVGFEITVTYLSVSFTDSLYSLIYKSAVFSFFYIISLLVLDWKQFSKDLKFIISHLRSKASVAANYPGSF